MRLTIPTPTDLKKVAVKIISIISNQNKEGSGTIVAIEDQLFVLTAGHVIADDQQQPIDVRNITIQKVKDGKSYEFTAEELLYYNSATDSAVIAVSNKDNMESEGWNQVRLLKEDIGGRGLLGGFREDKYQPLCYEFQKRGEHIWAESQLNGVNQTLSLLNNWKGFSGSGIFYKDETDCLYMAAFMSELGELEGNNAEFVCFNSIEFANVSPLDNIVDDRKHGFVADSGLIDSPENFYFNLIEKSLLKEEQKWEYISNRRQDEIIGVLKKDDEPFILLTALSGLGKSRLLFEAFRDVRYLPVCYYCKFIEGEQGLINDVKRILMRHRGEEGILIIDDCPISLMEDVMTARNRLNLQFRVIVTTHDFFSVNDIMLNGWHIVRLQPSELTEPINDYIETILQPTDQTRDDIEEIKKLSEGFPQMALELIEAYRDVKYANVDVVTHIMPKLLGINPESNHDEMTVMQMLSLCLPFPYKGLQEEAFTYMLNEDLFTPLPIESPSARRSIAEKLIDRYLPTLMDIQGDWAYVRPFPLAVWLTSEWFRNVCNSQSHFRDLLKSITEKPAHIKNAISLGFCKHIEQMHGNKQAFALVEKLVGDNVDNSFFNEEVLCSGLGSKFFLAMASVNPGATALCLQRVLESKNIEWLRDVFDGKGRRNIVWALEKLCFDKDSYDLAVMVMARLAVAENEEISNNATGQLHQLFHVQLAGTEVDLKTRLHTLELLTEKEDVYDRTVMGCFVAAFQNGNFTKMGGAERFGFENKKDYIPCYYPEVLDYWNGCRDLLLGWIDRKPVITELAGQLVEKNTFQWVRLGQWNLLIPLLERISTIKDRCWPEEYEELYKVKKTFKRNELGDDSVINLKHWIDRLRPSTFITSLKEARQELWSNYKLSPEESFNLSKKLFEPLADQFINEKVYQNKEEVKLILNDKEYVDHVFAKKLVIMMDFDVMSDFFALILEIVLEEDKKYRSIFLANFCEEAKDTAQLQTFLEELYEHHRIEHYLYLLAYSENDDLRNFYRISEEIRTGKLADEALSMFLSTFRAGFRHRYAKMVKAIHEVYPEDYVDLVDFIIVHRIYMDNDDDVDCQEIVRQALIKYPIDDENKRNLYEYVNLLIHILRKTKDDHEFAILVNRKMIEVYNEKMVSINAEGIFTELIKDYKDFIWDEFVEKLMSPDYFLFYYQVKDEIGSGFGFGEGPLFKIDPALIKELCFKYPESGPIRIASMAPCFDNDETGETERFSNWFLWLLDNFGTQKDVRDSLHANLGSYFWTGSTIPYHERNIRCFKKLLDHPVVDVREWAEKCIRESKLMLDSARSDEDFERINQRR